MEVLDFDLGYKEYQLGKSGIVVRIVANDVNFPVRLEEAIDNIQKHLEDNKQKYGINAEIDDIGNISTGDILTDIQFIKEADNYVKEQINYIFGYEISKDVFGNVSSFTVDKKNGEYLFEKFLNIFIPVVNEEFKTSIAKVKQRAKVYTDRKGMHPALRK